MFICQKCEPEYELCEGDTLVLCERNTNRRLRPRSHSSQTRTRRGGTNRV